MPGNQKQRDSVLFNLINLVGFQAGWWLLILYQQQYWWVVAGFLILHIASVPSRLNEVLVIFSTALSGVLIDSVLALLGVYIFSDSGQFLPVPYWLVLLWLVFAATVRHSLSYLRDKYWLAAALGAVGGPLSYLGGMKLGAVDFGYRPAAVLAILSIIWACLMPVIFLISHCVEAQLRQHVDAKVSG